MRPIKAVVNRDIYEEILPPSTIWRSAAPWEVAKHYATEFRNWSVNR
jgi:hypothetical protein